MRGPDLLRAACHGLAQHKVRTLLTLCGVTLGSLLLFCSIAGGLGVIRTVDQRLGVGERLMEIAVSSGFLVDEVSVEEAREAGFTQEMSDERRVRLAAASGVGGRRSMPLTIQTAKQLSSLDHVAHVWPDVDFTAAMHLDADDRWMQASVKALRPTKEVKDFLMLGRPFSSAAAHEIIVSELFLYHLGIQSDEALGAAMGSQVQFVPQDKAIVSLARQLAIQAKADPGKDLAQLRGELEQAVDAADARTEDFEIVGVLRALSPEEARFHPELAAAATKVFMPQEPAQAIWERTQSPGRRIRATVRADRPENVGRLEKALGERGYRTFSMAELALQIRSAVVLITAIITALALAALVISGIGITNTMVMNVMERRREIAIMKSIGAQDIDIQRVFLLEGLLIGVLGGVFGLVCGQLLAGLTSETIRHLLEWRLKLPFSDQIFASPWWLVVLTPLVAAGVTTIASALPARQAARVDPVATLRAL